MKKMILLVAVFLVSSAFVLYGKKINYLISEKPNTKTVRFSIYTGSDYSASLYKKSKAKVLLTVYKFTGNNPEIIWQDTVNEGSLKNYPSSDKPLFREVTVYNVLESSQTVCASYKVIYDWKGSNMSYEGNVALVRGFNENTMTIPI